MKLYATVASERASKGQGGNDRLEIDIFVGSAKESIKIVEGTVRKENDGYTVYITTLGQGESDQCIDTFVREKGEKQKGERTPENIEKWLENGEHDKLQEQDYIKGN